MASNTTNITNNTNSINSIQSQLNNLYTISGFTNNNNIIQTQLNTLSSVINIVASNNTFSNLNVSTINSISGIALNINSTGKPLFINSYNSDINLTSNTGSINIGSEGGNTNFYSSQNVNFNNIIDVDFNNNGNVNISPAGSINLTKAIFCNNSLTLPNNSNSSTNKLFLAGNDLNHSIYSTGSGGNSMYFNEFNEFIFYSTQRNANSLTIDNVGNVVTSGNINCGNITCTVGDNLLVDNIAGITNVYGYRYLQLYDMINIYDGMVIGYGSSSPHRLPINTIDVNGSIGATYYYNNIGKSSDTAQWFGFNNSSLGGIQMTYYNYWLILQGDRNLVLYDKSSGSQVAVWNSGTSVSDRNFKKNIVNTSISGIHSIKKINIVDYQYIESFEPDNKIRVGVIAQDLLHIVPEAVKWFDNPNYSISGTISGSISGSIYTDQLPGNYVVNLERIVPYLIKGMQEQQVIIDSLVNRISILENKIL